MTRTVLHVGCGPRNATPLPHSHFVPGEWQELRLDIDPTVKPDIVANMTDMHMVETASVGAVFSCHNQEHVHTFDAARALAEFRRVLAPDGFALIVVPDLQQVAALIAAGRLLEPAYMSPVGPIAPLDVLYGYRRWTHGNPHQQHRGGFTSGSLGNAMRDAGFKQVRAWPDRAFNAWGIGRAA